MTEPDKKAEGEISERRLRGAFEGFLAELGETDPAKVALVYKMLHELPELDEGRVAAIDALLAPHDDVDTPVEQQPPPAAPVASIQQAAATDVHVAEEVLSGTPREQMEKMAGLVVQRLTQLPQQFDAAIAKTDDPERRQEYVDFKEIATKFVGDIDLKFPGLLGPMEDPEYAKSVLNSGDIRNLINFYYKCESFLSDVPAFHAAAVIVKRFIDLIQAHVGVTFCLPPLCATDVKLEADYKQHLQQWVIEHPGLKLRKEVDRPWSVRPEHVINKTLLRRLCEVLNKDNEVPAYVYQFDALPAFVVKRENDNESYFGSGIKYYYYDRSAMVYLFDKFRS